MWPIPQKTADFVTFTEEILNEKLHFLCSMNDFVISLWSYLNFKELIDRSKHNTFMLIYSNRIETHNSSQTNT